MGDRVRGRGLRDCTVADRRDRRCAHAHHSRVRRAVRESGRPTLAGATRGGFGSAAGQNACSWRGDAKEISLLSWGLKASFRLDNRHCARRAKESGEE